LGERKKKGLTSGVRNFPLIFRLLGGKEKKNSEEREWERKNLFGKRKAPPEVPDRRGKKKSGTKNGKKTGFFLCVLKKKKDLGEVVCCRKGMRIKEEKENFFLKKKKGEGPTLEKNLKRPAQKEKKEKGGGPFSVPLAVRSKRKRPQEGKKNIILKGIISEKGGNPKKKVVS